ncbi:MAG: cardiolipin synthase [Pseudoalteromonas tetraodonis]|jgi:cardiolipin synthase
MNSCAACFTLLPFILDWINNLTGIWHWLLLGLTFAFALPAASHAVIYKRDSRSALLWVSLIAMVPLIGAALYGLLGVNRITRRGVSLRRDQAKLAIGAARPVAREELEREILNDGTRHLAPLMQLVDSITSQQLAAGNDIVPLPNGDAAYPEMLAAIDAAKVSVALTTYIFDDDPIGEKFLAALAAAMGRGVEVRVLVDDAGTRYYGKPITRKLRKLGIRFERFLPTFSLRRLGVMNLRNHRKILVVDGEIGFTGGMNIRHGNLLDENPDHPIKDLHFKVRGPVVCDLQETIAEDWEFCCGEKLRGERWFPRLEEVGDIVARGILDGPDEDIDKLHLAICGALSVACHRVCIATPYFLPNSAMISALTLAAMRGVEVDILIPEKNNLAYVGWAMNAGLWQVLHRGCRVWAAPSPFDHTKLLIVDGAWSLIGSSNLDPRSLRLNFEFNIECYSHEFASQLEEIFNEKKAFAREVTLESLDARSLPVRLRDGLARLATPFL